MPYRLKGKLKYLSIFGFMCLLLLVIEAFTTPAKLLHKDISSFSEYEKTLFQRIRSVDDAVSEIKAMSRKENTDRSLVVNAFTLLTKISSDVALLGMGKNTTAQHTIRSNYILWFLGKFTDMGDRKHLQSADRLLNYSYSSGYRCDQSTILLLHFLSDLGFQVNRLELTGHIAAEVLVDGKWIYLDPLNNISPYVTDGLPVSLEQLENNPILIDKYYIGEQLAKWKPVISSTHDNRTVPYSREQMLRFRYSRLELLADTLKWCFPFLLLISPAILRAISFLKNARVKK